jgi:hypothetical protein
LKELERQNVKMMKKLPRRLKTEPTRSTVTMAVRLASETMTVLSVWPRGRFGDGIRQTRRRLGDEVCETTRSL